MGAQMWMATKSGGAWVKMPDSGGVFTPVGWSSASGSNQGTFLNGGTAVRRSKTTHMEYNMSWAIAKRLQVSALRDFYAGVYGPGLIYFIDPMAADLNVLPEQWAFPASACYDGVPIISTTTNGVVNRPANVPTPANTFANPVESAQYSLTGTSRSLFIPIPPGFDAWVGITGSITGTGGLRVTPMTSPGVNGTAFFPTMIPVTSVARVNTKIAGASNYGLTLDLATSSALSTRTNLLNNPSGRRAQTGYVVFGGTLGQDAGADSYVSSTGTPTANNLGFTLESMVIGAGKLAASTTYTYSATIYGSNVNTVIQVSGTGVSAVTASSAVTSGAYTRVSVTFTTNASGTVAFQIINTTTAAVGSVIAFRDAMVEATSALGTYFDGSTPAAGNATNAWSGAADNSTSVQTLSTASTVILTAMCVQILPAGSTPKTGNFIGGLGHSGCNYETAPNITAIGSAIDAVTASWKLTETGDWL